MTTLRVARVLRWMRQHPSHDILPWIDVRAYGAVGDGVTDDRAAIQAAHDALPSTGGILFFPTPAVAYGVGGKITINKSGIWIMGSAPVHSYTGAVHPALIKALPSFTPTSDDMISISDGVNDILITNLEIDLNGVVVGAGLHIVTGGGGIGHTGIDLDGVLIRGNIAATNYALQVDSMLLCKWGYVAVTRFKNGMRWQALNHVADASLGNVHLGQLYIISQAPAVSGTNIYLQNFGHASIGTLISQGDDFTTSRTLLALDNVYDTSIQQMDLENALTGLTITGGSGSSARNAFLNGIIAVHNAVLLQGATYSTRLEGIAYIWSGIAGGTGINDQSNAAGTPYANNFNWVRGGIINGFTTLVSVANGPKLQIRDLSGYTPQNPGAIAVTASPFTYTNNDPWPEGVVIRGGAVTSVTGRAGTTFGGVNGVIYMYPGDSITVTYTSAPNMAKFPEAIDGTTNFLLDALGGGAAPTLGTIGGSGPASAAQNSWARMKDSGGNVFWVPAWK